MKEQVEPNDRLISLPTIPWTEAIFSLIGLLSLVVVTPFFSCIGSFSVGPLGIGFKTMSPFQEVTSTKKL
jgi:hypothetical protein